MPKNHQKHKRSGVRWELSERLTDAAWVLMEGLVGGLGEAYASVKFAVLILWIHDNDKYNCCDT